MIKQSTWSKHIIFAVGIILLIGTWYLLYLWLMAITESWLVPWDTWSEPVRPLLGTPDRAVNDFFESGWGSYLPALIIIIASLGLFMVKTVFFKTQQTSLPWLFAISNFVFLLSSLMLSSIGWQLADLWLSQPRPNIDVGYHRTWPMIVMEVILSALLLTIQAKANINWRDLSSAQRRGLLILSGLVCIGLGWFFIGRLF